MALTEEKEETKGEAVSKDGRRAHTLCQSSSECRARCAEARAVAAHWSSPSFIRKSSVLTLVQPVVRVREF